MDRDTTRDAQRRLAALERALEHNTRALETVAKQIALRAPAKDSDRRKAS